MSCNIGQVINFIKSRSPKIAVELEKDFAIELDPKTLFFIFGETLTNILFLFFPVFKLLVNHSNSYLSIKDTIIPTMYLGSQNVHHIKCDQFTY